MLIPRTRGGCSWRTAGIGLGEIAAAGAHLVAFVLRYFDADSVVLAVKLRMRRDVGDGILIAQLVADVLEGLVEIVDVIRKECAAACFVSQVLQNLIAFGEMGFAVGSPVRVGLRELN